MNLYRARIATYPDRIFLGTGGEDEQQRFERIRAGYSRCYVELGSGSGGHAIALAERDPQLAMVGFELRFKRAVRTIEKAEQRGLNNVFVFRTRGEGIQRYFLPQTIDGLYVNFPDPWEKKHQRKHRILSPWLLDAAAELLAKDGFLSVKTDHEEYFDSFTLHLAADSRFQVCQSSRNAHAEAATIHSPCTEFESMFIAQGLPIYYVQARLRA